MSSLGLFIRSHCRDRFDEFGDEVPADAVELHPAIGFPVAAGAGEVEDQAAPGEVEPVAVVEAVERLMGGRAGGLVQCAVAGRALQVEAEHGGEGEILDGSVHAVGADEVRVEGFGEYDLASFQLLDDLGLEPLVGADVVESRCSTSPRRDGR